MSEVSEELEMKDQGATEGLDRLRDVHVAALNAGDADAWADCFVADAVQMPPNQPANVGIDDIRQWSRGFLGAFSVEFSLDPAEVELAGPGWAFERGAYEIALTPSVGGGPMRDRGKYLTVYRNDADGEWLIANDIWNSDSQAG